MLPWECFSFSDNWASKKINGRENKVSSSTFLWTSVIQRHIHCMCKNGKRCTFKKRTTRRFAEIIFHFFWNDPSSRTCARITEKSSFLKFLPFWLNLNRQGFLFCFRNRPEWNKCEFLSLIFWLIFCE